MEKNKTLKVLCTQREGGRMRKGRQTEAYRLGDTQAVAIARTPGHKGAPQKLPH